ncbi:MAG TPA: hypothetical protein VLY24_03095 [Bryobacteraceae bacterium]|nr:hypothetical protein [Bryobacteraceae bacterium]
MRQEDQFAIPAASQCLIAAASMVVPQAHRSAWRSEWLWEVWHAHADLVRQGCPPAQASRRVVRFAWGALRDSIDLRVEHWKAGVNRRALAREPLVCLAALLLVFLSLWAWTNGFHRSRVAAAASYPDSQQLVLLSRPTGVLGLESAASMEQVWSWVEESKWFGSVAGFWLHDGTLEVSPNFFAVLHTDPVLGSVRWRFLGRPVRTVKFLAPGSAELFGGAIARLKERANRSLFETQLGKLGNDGNHITATFLEERSRWPLYFASVSALVFLAMGVVRVRRTALYTVFFLAKTALLLGSVGLAWTEVATAIPIPITGGVDLGTAIPLVFLLLIGQAFVLRWSHQDQAGRCPVCCRQVAMPITVGSRSSLILDRPGVEFLCTRGHGTLRLSDLTACTGEPYRWTPLDRSWQEIFVGEKTA